MTQEDFENLKIGDIITGQDTGDEYELVKITRGTFSFDMNKTGYIITTYRNNSGKRFSLTNFKKEKK